MTYRIIQGDNRLKLKDFPDNHFDSVVCDPPYGIDFLGKAWDANTGALETYQECLRVLKPGGHLLAFSAARTYHHLAITLEQAGFEIRDQIMWIYSSGFPKSQDVGKSIDRSAGIKHKYTYTKNNEDTRNIKNSGTSSTPYCIKCDANMTYPSSQCKEQCDAKRPPIQSEWAGWGTALKPAHEPICMARKPIKQSIAKNCQKWGTGALNIDATRIPYEQKDLEWSKGVKRSNKVLLNEMNAEQQTKQKHPEEEQWQVNEQGRFPSNVLGEIAEPYQKYFYCPKVSRKERHIGFDIPKEEKDSGLAERGVPGDFFSNNISDYGHNKAQQGNNHPTVKPIELMKYLIKLVTPKGGRVLDPFNGSGSTGCAAVELGHEYVGIELDPKYCEIAKKRIEAWNKQDTTFTELFV
jgi:DNA modification methylase